MTKLIAGTLVGVFFMMTALLTLSGCVLTPRGTAEERARADLAGKPFEQPVEQRTLPELPLEARWQDVLHRTFLTNGDLEAAYFDWKAALAKIQQAAGYPNTNLAPQFSYLFSPGHMKAFDRTTVGVGFDPMQNLSFPTKVAQVGKVALEEARAAGKNFEVKKFEIQQKVLTNYLDLALHEEKIRIQRDNVSLLKLLADTAADRVRAGGNQQDLLKAQTNFRLAENELASMEFMHMTMRAMLNGMMARDPNAPLGLPPGLPAPRPIAVDDAQLIALAVDQNPGLAQLARQVAGRKEALELAHMQFIPDINPFAGFTGTASQSIGAMLILPTTIPQIRGRIDESRAMLRSADAMLRQARADRAASFVAALYVLRNSERQTQVFEQAIRPRAEQAMASSREAYASGSGTFIDLIDSQRTFLEVRLMIAEARIEREKRLAELETLAGVDIETLMPPTTIPSTQPVTQSATRPAASPHPMDMHP
jgi:cobalt-zinc-cadmium efflux system outer membrane protein